MAVSDNITRLANNKEPVKVFLPGESLWAKPIQYKDGLMQARIDNDPISDLHGYKYGDLVTFKIREEFNTWELADMDEQL